jgi:hypothetical protein
MTLLRHLTAVVPCFLATAALAQQAPVRRQAESLPAPTRITYGARLYVEEGEFGMALSAALLKKKVPVVVLRDRDKADFFVETTSASKKEGAGERVAKILAFGVFAGSGKSFDATVSITNRDGAVVFAHNSKKENFQSAAENVAKNLKKYIES